MEIQGECSLQNAQDSLLRQLNDLVVHYEIFQSNILSFQKSVKGAQSIMLRYRFDELRWNLMSKTDQIFERLTAVNKNTYTPFADKCQIKEARNVRDSTTAILSVLDSLSIIIGKQHEIINITKELDDVDTNKLMHSLVRDQEKLVYTYSTLISQ